MTTAIFNGALTALSLVGALVSRVFKSKKTDSLVAFTKATRVEPIALIDRRVSHLPYISDVMQSMSSIFSAYYLQAIAIMTHVDSINVIRALDALNPQRDVADASATIVDYVGRKKGLLSSESYHISLPRVDDRRVNQESFTLANMLTFDGKCNPSMEDAFTRQLGQHVKDALVNPDGTAKDADQIDFTAATQHVRDNTGAYSSKQMDDLGRAAGHGDVKDAIKTLNEAVNLSVGKMLSVKIGSGDKAATFPIMVRLIATFVDANVLTHILGDGSRNITMRERYHSWRSNQLEFWRDLVLCQDLIDEHKAAMVKDKSGTYDEILDRRLKNGVSAKLTDTPSVGTASNLLVISKQTVKDLEREIGGSIDRFEIRQKVFASTYIMIMAVVDPEWELVTFYHRGIKLPSKLSIKELKVSNKGTGPDVGELLKAYMLGNAPSP
jgi:hypothetical protein